MATRINPQRAQAWSRGSVVAIAAAVGLVVGLRSIARVELPGFASLLALPPLPREAVGVAWSSRALWPGDVQGAALERLVGVVAALALAAVAVATLNVIVLLAESTTSRAGEMAVRAAVGATPLRLVTMLLAELKTLVAGGLALGLILGLAAGAAARAAWPGLSLPPRVLAGSADLTGAVALLLVLLAGAHVTAGLAKARSSRLPGTLRGGSRLSADPGAIFARNTLSATHVAVAGTALVGAITLSSALTEVQSVTRGTEETVTIEGTAPVPGAWEALLGHLKDVPGLAAESLATPGALAGLGVRDVVTGECGRCSIGGMPTPIVGAVADHHAVSEGYFQLAGIPLLLGRAFRPEDDADAPPVAIVSRAFANSSFENGQPLGKRIRVGASLHDWYMVVGVVDDMHLPVLGSEEVVREAVYLSARQHPPRSGVLLLRGDAAVIEGARLAMAGAGFSPGEPTSLRGLRERAAATVRWTYRAATFLALVILLLAAHGVYVTALQTTRRRTLELAVRRAVGASSAQLVRHVLGERLKVTAWGLMGQLFFGTLVVAILVGTVGLRPLPAGRYVEVGGILLVTALAATLRAARDALAVEPATVLM